ncbi:class I SAM-dependent methyltransferase [Pseudohalioglobus lutimaris]|uniref:SAM-dependent methyltransferase n=1 Tax=Pseudohalioglobus lutimaris TaxID=1737061 RepID=A0A2N5WYE4_9GAMM|nr:class I SAM-dependent methyltransferase [Pseudohalioglobus lutimaris]PLW67263.1 SAM-dependent methyltransferase [Pseudohalioglobus lutimaris]
MEELSLLVDLHKHQQRQGPGSEEVTARAVELAGLRGAGALRIVDIGCGTGAASLQLAKMQDASITAVDLLPDFIEVLRDNAAREGLSGSIKALVGSMDKLPFADGEFDVVWSEGAVYNIGFAEGVRQWRRLLRPGGILLVSEISWLSLERPGAVQRYWDAAYPEIATQAEKTEQLENSGYEVIDTFTLPEACWMENYYLPLLESFDDFLARHPGDSQAAALVEAEKTEIELYRQYSDFYSYCMYIARVRR